MAHRIHRRGFHTIPQVQPTLVVAQFKCHHQLSVTALAAQLPLKLDLGAGDLLARPYGCPGDKNV